MSNNLLDKQVSLRGLLRRLTHHQEGQSSELVTRYGVGDDGSMGKAKQQVVVRKEVIVDSKGNVREVPTRRRNWAKTIVSFALIVWAFAGFSNFMYEEAGQGFMFSTFPLQEVGAVELLAERADEMRQIARLGRINNLLIGWTNPFMFPAYQMTWKSQEAYAQSLDTLVAYLSNGPQATASASSSTSAPAEINLSDAEFLPPNFTEPPQIEGAIVVNKASEELYERLAEAAKYGFAETVIFPVTATGPGNQVSRAPASAECTPLRFEIVTWNYDLVPTLVDLEHKWVVVRGQVKLYEKAGIYQIVINQTGDIQEVADLIATGGA